MTENKNIFNGSKEYLEKSFLEELNYKIWSTKGARFQADRRLKKVAKISNLSLGFLSAYLIIAGLISVYQINNNTELNDKLINYYITALSIILLVISQFENNQDYKLRAKVFHDCGLKLAELYNRLRTFKTINTKATEDEIKTFCEELSNEYQNILNQYENHDLIDYEIFKTKNLDYFTELTPKDIKRIKRKNNWMIHGWYSIIIIVPPIIIVMITIFKNVP